MYTIQSELSIYNLNGNLKNVYWNAQKMSKRRLLNNYIITRWVVRTKPLGRPSKKKVKGSEIAAFRKYNRRLRCGGKKRSFRFLFGLI